MNKMYLNYYYIGHGIYLDIKIILLFINFNFYFFVKILLVFIIHNIIEF
jgi:hypothetical protein